MVIILSGQIGFASEAEPESPYQRYEDEDGFCDDGIGGGCGDDDGSGGVGGGDDDKGGGCGDDDCLPPGGNMS